jgi:hypothetical protein
MFNRHFSSSKYGNRKTIIDNWVFDSKLEARRYQHLKMLQRAGRISGLICQPKFLLLEKFTDKTGKKHREINYFADFQYKKEDGSGLIITEDTKGKKTAIYDLKKKMLLSRYPDINFFEISS